MNAELVLGQEDDLVLVGIGTQGNVYVRIPYKLQLEVKGFCGNYDNDEINDYVTEQLEDVSNSEDPGKLVGQSFIVNDEKELVQFFLYNIHLRVFG